MKNPRLKSAAACLIAILLAGCATSADHNRSMSVAQLDAETADANPCPVGTHPVSESVPGAGLKCRASKPALNGDPKRQQLRQPIAVGLGAPVPAYFGGSNRPQ